MCASWVDFRFGGILMRLLWLASWFAAGFGLALLLNALKEDEED